jgi:hypothetical protein
MPTQEQRLTQIIGNLPSFNQDELNNLGQLQRRALLESYVFALEPNLFVFKDVPEQTILQLEIMFLKLEKLAASQEDWYLLVDLRNVKPPEAQVRAFLQEKYSQLATKGLRFAALVVANKVIELAVKLVGARQMNVPYGICHSFGAGLALIKSAQNLNEAKAKPRQ